MGGVPRVVASFQTWHVGLITGSDFEDVRI
jgi:hypothetical protein